MQIKLIYYDNDANIKLNNLPNTLMYTVLFNNLRVWPMPYEIIMS